MIFYIYFIIENNITLCKILAIYPCKLHKYLHGYFFSIIAPTSFSQLKCSCGIGSDVIHIQRLRKRKIEAAITSILRSKINLESKTHFMFLIYHFATWKRVSEATLLNKSDFICLFKVRIKQSYTEICCIFKILKSKNSEKPWKVLYLL